MRHIDLKANLTWHDVVIRVVLVLVTASVIVWFMPRETQQNFKIELGKPWRYADLTAPFDFPIYKSEATLKAQCDSVLRDYEPYYVKNMEMADVKVRDFVQEYNKLTSGGYKDYKSIIANRLHQFYDQGIVDTKEPAINGDDTLRTIRVVIGNTAKSVSLSSTLTPKQAYEKLMGDAMLQSHRDVLTELNLNDFIVPNLIYDKERSEASKQDLIASVPMASGVALSGQKLIDRGTIVDEQKLLLIESFQRESDRRNQSESRFTTTVLGELLYVLLLVTGFTIFLSIFRSDYFDNMRSVIMIYSLIVVFSIAASLMVGHNILHVFIIPFAMVPIFIRVFMDSRTAFMAHTALVLITACVLQHPLEFIAVQITAGLTAILSLRDLSSRSQLLWTAGAVTVASCLMVLALDLITVPSFRNLSFSDYNYLIICGLVLFCSYPLLYIMEKTFGYTSNITLIELSDMNKELLRRMSEVAPGTFQHSIQVSNLGAEIARKIGAKAQLVRTGALYHDIGKIQNPIYYTENQSGGINPHEQISDIESAQIIISHVTEGLKLAEKYNLPDVIKGFISTHHGQGKAKFFYVNYKNAHPDEEVDELLFTYPGPNPFTKEQAILMMADAVEAASRSLPDYTEQSIRSLVDRIIDSMVSDGYFRECPITFRDIQYSKTVLIEKLKTIYHTRISYPELKSNQ
ncbi:HDIG domain-containing protein [Prevotella sp. E9-3]|uniref:HD family phosphohydrolase n=1 Tax=Prevotella sp. E9-3 TaxID=2913621 RepID=UPI001EDA953B|nr:HDIG domain-containing metalloprotein [Prevotella sp. E9-3]UKK47925.1 HDIG domain-containing protein [Prevotella sp. E9-3]